MSRNRVQVEKGYDDPFVIVHNGDVLELMKRVKPTSVCVYLAILTHANRREGNSAYPSTATIAREANVSRRTVVAAVQELAEAGAMTVEHRTDPKKGQVSSLYRLLRLSDPCAKSAQAPVKDLHTPCAESAQPPMQNLHTNQMKEEPEEGEPKNTPQRRKPKRIQYPDEFERFWSAYPKGHGVKKLAYDEWKKIAPDDEMVEEIMAGLEAWKRCQRWRDGFIKDAERFVKHHMWESAPPVDSVRVVEETRAAENVVNLDYFGTDGLKRRREEYQRQHGGGAS